MKLSQWLFTIWLCCARSALCIDVSDAISAVSGQPRSQSVRQVEAQRLLKSASASEVLKSLLEAVSSAKRQRDEDAAIRLVLALDPFPFEELELILASEQQSNLRANEIWLLNKGARTASEVERVTEEAKKLLGDEGIGFQTYGEGRGYAPLGLRVCDAAYNVVVQRLNLTNKMPFLEASTIVPERNKKIDQLCASIALETHRWTEPHPPRGEPATLDPPLIQQQSTSKPATPTAAVPQLGSISWLVWLLVVIAATVGAVWVFLRRSK